MFVSSFKSGILLSMLIGISAVAAEKSTVIRQIPATLMQSPVTGIPNTSSLSVPIVVPGVVNPPAKTSYRSMGQTTFGSNGITFRQHGQLTIGTSAKGKMINCRTTGSLISCN